MKRNLKRGTMRTRSKPRKRVTKRRITGGANGRGAKRSPEGTIEQQNTKRPMIEGTIEQQNTNPSMIKDITNGLGGMTVSNNLATKAANNAAAKKAANNAAAAAKKAANNAAAAKKAANNARAQPKHMVRPPALNQSDNAFGPLDQRNIELFERVISFMKNKGRDISFDDFITDDRFHRFLHFTYGSGVDLKNKDAPEYNKFKKLCKYFKNYYTCLKKHRNLYHHRKMYLHYS
jgi:hypothetical protein